MDPLMPLADFAGTRPLLALDVDGVLNRFNDEQGPARRLVRTAHGAKYWIDFDPAVIAELDDIVRAHGLELGWLTTWGPNVRALIEQAFDGLLSGGFVLAKMPPLYRGRRPDDWKLQGLRSRVALTGRPWVWADDEEVYPAELAADDVLATAPGLPVPTDPVAGLTPAQLAEIRAFAAAL